MRGFIAGLAALSVFFLAGVSRADDDATPTPAAATPEAPAPTPSPTATPATTIPSAAALENMSLEELLNVPIAAASREEARPLRESPGVITLVTRDQILASGARDLMDVLMLVPGFSMGIDVEGIVGPSFRGNWAYEGKSLLLVDGHAMNELLFLNLPLGNRLPVDQIEKIEIIRGPGSVSFGGAAEVDVINVVTRGASSFDGKAYASALGGQTARAAGRRDLSLAWGMPAKTENGVSLSIGAFGGVANRGDRIYTDPDGGTWNMANDSALRDLYLNAQLGWRGLDVRFLTDTYTVTERDGFGYIFEKDADKEFQQHYFDARYPIHAGAATITPRFSYAREYVWRTLKDQVFSNGEESTYYDPAVIRYTGELAGAVKAFAGVSVTRDDYFANSTPAGVSQHGFVDRVFGGSDTIDDHGLPFRKKSYGNAAGFGEVSWDSSIVNVVAGARYEYHSRFGAAFTPRIALTHAWERAHVKLLATRAFRPPSIGNLDYNNELKPEYTNVLEAEAGYRISDHAFIAANVFDVTLEKPIVFTIAVNGTANYYNFSHSGSRGAELTAQTSFGPVTSNASVSFYSAAGKNRVVDYVVPGHSDLALGAAHVKAALATSVNCGRGLIASVTGVWLGERFSIEGYDAGGAPITVRDEPILLANAQIAWRHIANRFDVAVGGYNLLGGRFAWAEPYAGGHPQIPAEPREFTMRVSASF